jgi:hypothetical protein
VEEVKPEVEKRSRNGLAINEQVGLNQVPAYKCNTAMVRKSRLKNSDSRTW